MANPNRPFGFVPTRSLRGGCSDPSINSYTITSGLAENIGIGDMVKSNGSGGIQLAAAGDAILGCFRGVNYTAADGSQHFVKRWVSGTTLMTGTTAEALVIDDPYQMYKVQSSGTIAATDIGQFVDLTAATPSAIFGRSAEVISVPTDGSPSQFRIEGIIVEPYNDGTNQGFTAAGAYALCEVAIVKHERRGSAAGVEV